MGHIDITSLLHMQQYNLVKGLPPKKIRIPKNTSKTISHIPPLVTSLVDLVILNSTPTTPKEKQMDFY
jgi:hypothetical protein